MIHAAGWWQKVASLPLFHRSLYGRGKPLSDQARSKETRVGQEKGEFTNIFTGIAAGKIPVERSIGKKEECGLSIQIKQALPLSQRCVFDKLNVGHHPAPL